MLESHSIHYEEPSSGDAVDRAWLRAEAIETMKPVMRFTREMLEDKNRHSALAGDILNLDPEADRGNPWGFIQDHTSEFETHVEKLEEAGFTVDRSSLVGMTLLEIHLMLHAEIARLRPVIWPKPKSDHRSN